jgi:hypothetical protein
MLRSAWVIHEHNSGRSIFDEHAHRRLDRKVGRSVLDRTSNVYASAHGALADGRRSMTDDYIIRRTKDGWSVYRNGERVCSLAEMSDILKWVQNDKAERSAGDEQKGK